MTINGPEHGTLLDPGSPQPRNERGYGAISGPPMGNGNLAPLTQLICFRSPQMEDDGLADRLDILNVKADQFRATKSPCEPNKE